VLSLTCEKCVENLNSKPEGKRSLCIKVRLILIIFMPQAKYIGKEGLERGPISFVNTIEELLERNSSGFSLEIRDYDHRDHPP
jgi:hypothetical protein